MEVNSTYRATFPTRVGSTTCLHVALFIMCSMYVSLPSPRYRRSTSAPRVPLCSMPTKPHTGCCAASGSSARTPHCLLCVSDPPNSVWQARHMGVSSVTRSRAHTPAVC
jgi:hypothetical protein